MQKTKKQLFLLLSFSLTIIFTSCEGHRCADGKVVDKITGTPLDSVYIEVLSSNELYNTDASGMFEVCNVFKGCVPECKDIIVRFSKSNYKTITLTNPPANLVIEMEQ